MKTVATAFVLFFAFGASAKDLNFKYPCKVYHFVGSGENSKEVELNHPRAKTYTFVKTAVKTRGKWQAKYSIDIALKAGGKIVLPLVPAGSGDEGYNEYEIPTKGKNAGNFALVNEFWISSGAIYNNSSGGSFEGEKAKGENAFFECRKK